MPVVVDELHADVGGFLARLDLQFSGPRSRVSIIGRDGLAAQRQGHALDFSGVIVVIGLHGVVATAGGKDQQSRGRQGEWQFRLKVSHFLHLVVLMFRSLPSRDSSAFGADGSR